MKRTSLIMAGGGGTRFWPLSRQGKPKQLLNIFGKDIMINETIERLNGLVEYPDIYIITNTEQGDVLAKILNEQVPRRNILKEPAARNTAACTLLSAMTIQKRIGDSVMGIFPADHFIGNPELFRDTISQAYSIAETSGNIVTIGIEPTFPSTGFGYLKYNGHGEVNCVQIEEFVEKPDFASAKRFIDSGRYLWNSGIFFFKASVIIDNFKRFLPRMFRRFEEITDQLDSEEGWQALTDAYAQVPSISIDYGIMERCDEVVAVKGSFGWNDVGSWDSLGSIYPPDDDGNIMISEHVAIDTHKTIVFSPERLVALIGVEDLIVANSPDALLVCKKERAQEVREIVEILKLKGMNKYL